MPKTTTVNLTTARAITLELTLPGADGKPETIALDPSIYDVMGYEAALVDASKLSDNAQALRAAAKATFDHLACYYATPGDEESRMALAPRILRLGALAQRAALEAVEAWYEDVTGGAKEGPRAADPTPGSSRLRKSPAARRKKSRNGTAAGRSGGSKRRSTRTNGRRS